MRFWIPALAALIGLTGLSTVADAQDVDRFFDRPGDSRTFDHDDYHNRYRRWYGSRPRYFPDYRSVPNDRHYNRYFHDYDHRRYHQRFGRPPYSTYYRRPGLYYNSPGFGFWYSF